MISGMDELDVKTCSILWSQGFYNPNLKIIEDNPAAKQERIEQSASQITIPTNVQIYAPPDDPVATFVGRTKTVMQSSRLIKFCR
jgi:hypothetical protein